MILVNQVKQVKKFSQNVYHVTILIYLFNFNQWNISLIKQGNIIDDNEIKIAEIKVQDQEKKNINESNKSLNTSSIVLLSLIAIIMILIICYIIFDCSKRNHVRKLNLKGQKNTKKEYNKVPSEL